MKNTFQLCAMLLLLVFSKSLYAFSLKTDWYDQKPPVYSTEYLGLEWLSWEQTIGLSISEALTIYEKDGWRLANSEEITNLFNNFLPSEYLEYDPDTGTYIPTTKPVFENTPDTDQFFFYAPSHSKSMQFFEAFGVTDIYCDWFELSGETLEGCSTWASAFYEPKPQSGSSYNLAFFEFYDWEYDDSTAKLSSSKYTENSKFSTQPSDTHPNPPAAGVALVRGLDYTPPTPVPVPELDAKKGVIAFALLLGILFVLRERRHHFKLN